MNVNLPDEPEFTDEQLRAALKRVGIEARQAAFAASLPIVIIRDQKLIALYADGTEKILKDLDSGESPFNRAK